MVKTVLSRVIFWNSLHDDRDAQLKKHKSPQCNLLATHHHTPLCDRALYTFSCKRTKKGKKTYVFLQKLKNVAIVVQSVSSSNSRFKKFGIIKKKRFFFKGIAFLTKEKK